MKTIYAIGDIHGCADLLELALKAIERDGAKDRHLVFLGDYVDRGTASRQVVERLMDLDQWSDTTCIRGNHEDMMIMAIRHQVRVDFWLRYGGAATLSSYAGAVPTAHIAWMDRLPYVAEIAGRVFVHAGLMPDVSLADQEPEVVSGIRDRFLLAEERFRFWPHIVHGHTPCHPHKPRYEDVELLNWRTNLDSGAFKTGVLSVGVFEGEGGPAARVLRVRLP